MNFRPIFLAAVGALMAIAVATPALAEWDRGRHRGYDGPRFERPDFDRPHRGRHWDRERHWDRGGHWDRGDRGYGGYRGYVQPHYARPVYAPPHYYRAPPPQFYFGPRW